MNDKIMSVMIDSIRIASDNKMCIDVSRPLKKPFLGESYINTLTRMALLGCDQISGSFIADNLNEEELGICVATYGAYYESFINQYEELKTRPKPFISPAIGVNSTPNAICSQVAIYCRAKAFAETVNDFCTAGFEAFIYGCQAIGRRTAKHVLIVGCGTNSNTHLMLFNGYCAPASAAGSEEQNFEEATVCLLSAISNPLNRQGRLLHYRTHSRGYFQPGESIVYKKVLARCLEKIYSFARQAGITIGTVLLGSLENFWDTEQEVIAEIEKKRPRFLGFFETGSGIKCISALTKLHSLYRMYRMEDNVTEIRLIREKEPALEGNGLLLIDNGFDGSLGCMLLEEGNAV